MGALAASSTATCSTLDDDLGGPSSTCGCGSRRRGARRRRRCSRRPSEFVRPRPLSFAPAGGRGPGLLVVDGALSGRRPCVGDRTATELRRRGRRAAACSATLPDEMLRARLDGWRALRAGAHRPARRRARRAGVEPWPADLERAPPAEPGLCRAADLDVPARDHVAAAARGAGWSLVLWHLAAPLGPRGAGRDPPRRCR